jgi:glycosyltransferase involved in cell wall biosynthesis
MAPLLSIIIVNYNYARFLRRSIQSALAQDYPNVEVVIVDDCSTDNSCELIARFGGRVRAVLRERNEGHGAAMNAGFAAAAGKVTIFLDADDYLYPFAGRRIMSGYEPEIAQYQYRLDLVDAAGKVMDVYPPREVKWQDGDVRCFLCTRGRYATTVTSGLAFSRGALENILPMDEAAFRQGGDGYLVTVAPLYGSVRTVDETLGAYCQHGSNHSQFAVLQRARWRMLHDKMRYDALRQHANRLGLKLAVDLWRNDPLHLEERVASLLLDPHGHPDPSDRRSLIARNALAASNGLPISGRRRQLMKMWWLLVGYGPESLAQRAVSWKLQAATRPAVVRSMARAMRHMAG